MWAEVTCSPGVSEDTYRVMVYRDEAAEVSSGKFQTHFDTLYSCILKTFRDPEPLGGNLELELTENGSGIFVGQASVSFRPVEDEQFQLAIVVKETETSPEHTLKSLCVYDSMLLEYELH